MSDATEDDEVAEAEVVGDDFLHGTTADPSAGTLVRTEQGPLMRPVAPLEQIREAFTDYVALTENLLDPREDFQVVSGKKFPKKSALRKLAVAFGVTCEIVTFTHQRDAAGRIVSSEFVVRAIAPGGRVMDGYGSCDLWEKCKGDKCKKPEHDPADHFSHTQHDIPATAETRAKNRAFSDLFSMGQVSAEEVGDAPQWEVLGWPNEGGYRRLMDPLHDALKGDAALAVEWKAWRTEHKVAWPVPNADAREVRIWMQEHRVGVDGPGEYDQDSAMGEGRDQSMPETGDQDTPAAPPPAGTVPKADGRGGVGDGMSGEQAGVEVHPARTEAPAPTPVPMVTKSQLQRIAIMCGEIVKEPGATATADEYGHALADAVSDHRVQSRKELTRDEAARALDALKAIKAGTVMLSVSGEVGALAELLEVS